MTWSKCYLTGVFMFLVSGCMSTADVQPPKLIHNQHILVNKILDVQSGRFIDKAQLIHRILASDYLLLGEIHDNFRHHQLQAHLINQLRKGRRHASVSFEMIDQQQGEILQRQPYTSSSDLIALLNQTKSRWPYERDYQVVFDSVIAAGFDILPANLEHSQLIQIIKRGELNLPEHIRLVMKQTPLSTQQNTDLQNEIIRGHCDMIPAEATQPMMLAQRVRDVVMSLSLLNSGADIKVLIAGAGHARTDRGVPLYLRNKDKQARIVSLAFQEVKQGATSIEDYSERWDGQGLPFDYVWFTPGVQRTDPCDDLKHRLNKNR